MPPPSTPRGESGKPPGQSVADIPCAPPQCPGGVAEGSDSSSEYSGEYSGYSSEEETAAQAQTPAKVKPAMTTEAKLSVPAAQTMGTQSPPAGWQHCEQTQTSWPLGAWSFGATQQAGYPWWQMARPSVAPLCEASWGGETAFHRATEKTEKEPAHKASKRSDKRKTSKRTSRRDARKEKKEKKEKKRKRARSPSTNSSSSKSRERKRCRRVKKDGGRRSRQHHRRHRRRSRSTRRHSRRHRRGERTERQSIKEGGTERRKRKVVLREARRPTPPLAAQKTKADKVAVAAPLAEKLGCSLAELCRGEPRDVRPNQKLDMPLAELCGDVAGSRPNRRRGEKRGGVRQKAKRDRRRAAAPAFEQKQPEEDDVAEKPEVEKGADEEIDEETDEETEEEAQEEVEEEAVDWTNQ